MAGSTRVECILEDDIAANGQHAGDWWCRQPFGGFALRRAAEKARADAEGAPARRADVRQRQVTLANAIVTDSARIWLMREPSFRCASVHSSEQADPSRLKKYGVVSKMGRNRENIRGGGGAGAV